MSDADAELRSSFTSCSPCEETWHRKPRTRDCASLSGWSPRWLIAVAIAPFFAGCGAEVSETDPEVEAAAQVPAEIVTSHQQMLDVLLRVHSLRLYEKTFWGQDTIDTEVRRLAARQDTRTADYLHACINLGRRWLWMGKPAKASELFDRVLQTCEKNAGRLSDTDRNFVLFQAGRASLREGENQNCVKCNNAASCLIPIQEAGFHQEKAGSQGAIRYFTQLLELEPDHGPARWLLNIAYMTLGEYPKSVPAHLVIPEERFVSAEFPRFTNVAGDYGLNIVSCSGGVCTEDFDSDGDLDILTSAWLSSDQIRYFENRGKEGFKETTKDTNLTGIYGGLNSIHADYDNDGDCDAYVLRGAWLKEAGMIPNSLLQNDGTGRFYDVTFAVGMGKEHFPTQTAVWLDFDNDGDLDLYVGNEDFPCQLFENLGARGFRDVAAKAGVENNGYTKGVTAGDVNGDNFPDLYVSNLRSANRLYINNRNGTFTDTAESAGVQNPIHSFPTWMWDFDQDGQLDIFVAGYAATLASVEHRFLAQGEHVDSCRLYRGLGDGTFQDVTAEAGLEAYSTAMGSNFGDLNNDGFPDFYLGTGYPGYDGLMPNAMYLNQEGKRFLDVTFSGGFGHLQKGHSVAFADLDDDGDQDIFEQMGGAFPGDAAANALYQNPGFGNNWVRIRLEGRRTNRSAIGARVHLTIMDQGQPRDLYRWVGTGGSFGAGPLRLEVGLGRAELIKRLEVYWPVTQQTQVFEDLAVRGHYHIIEDDNVLR